MTVTCFGRILALPGTVPGVCFGYVFGMASKGAPRHSQGIPKDTKGRPSESFGKFQNSLKNHWFLQYFQLQRHRWMILFRFQRSLAPQGTPKTPQGAHNDDQAPPRSARGRSMTPKERPKTAKNTPDTPTCHPRVPP